MVCANRESRGIMHWQLVTDDYGHIIQPRQRKVPQKIHLPNDQIDFYRAIKLIFKEMCIRDSYECIMTIFKVYKRHIYC